MNENLSRNLQEHVFSFFFSTLWSETVQTFFEDVLQGYVLLSVLRYVNEVALKK